MGMATSTTHSGVGVFGDSSVDVENCWNVALQQGEGAPRK